jgi:hypothetical protein
MRFAPKCLCACASWRNGVGVGSHAVSLNGDVTYRDSSRSLRLGSWRRVAPIFMHFRQSDHAKYMPPERVVGVIVSGMGCKVLSEFLFDLVQI